MRRCRSCLRTVFVPFPLQYCRALQGLGSLREKAASHRKHHLDQGLPYASNGRIFHSGGKRVSASFGTYPAHAAPFGDTDVEMTGESKASGGAVCLLAARVARVEDASVQVTVCACGSIWLRPY